MTDIEQKARDMVREEDEHGYLNYDAAVAALCRAIEQHEAFRQEVSDAVAEYFGPKHLDVILAGHLLSRFIIPAPKPDSLVEVFCKGLWSEAGLSISTKEIRAALEARGLEIREKNDD